MNLSNPLSSKVDDEESISEDENKEKGVVVIQQFIWRYLAKRRLQKDAEVDNNIVHCYNPYIYMYSHCDQASVVILM